jgi:hypothetical protein
LLLALTKRFGETKRVGDGYLIKTAKNIRRKVKFEKSKKGSLPYPTPDLGGEGNTNLQAAPLGV